MPESPHLEPSHPKNSRVTAQGSRENRGGSITSGNVAKHVLITGFEPFGGQKSNPSELVTRSLDGRLIAGRLIVTQILPVQTRPLRARLAAAIQADHPDLIILTGVAGGRSGVSVERVAVNALDFTLPDNVGVKISSEPIVAGGVDAHLSNLPFARIIGAWKEHGVPGYVSNSAGTYVCNQALYETFELTKNLTPAVIAGFVHFPFLPAQAIEAGAQTHPSMSLDLMQKSIEVLLETVIPWIDQREPAGLSAAATSQSWIPRGVKELER